MNNLQVPKYEQMHSRPVIGHGNFSRTIQKSDTHCMVDKLLVERKFKLWDEVLEGDYLTDNGFHINSDNERIIENADKYKRYLQSIVLLGDKAIFAYHHFRFDNKPFKLRWYQDIMLSDDHKRILFASSNQIGKSLALDADAAIEFMRDHGKEWVGILVSKSLGQSRYQMDRIKQLLKSSNVTYRIEDTAESKTGKQDGAFTISYTFYDEAGKIPLYTNLLICSPPTGSALGYPADGLWLDEFDFWINIDQNWFIQQVAIPRTIETDGFIKVFSNPDGRDKELYVLWLQKELDDDNEYTWHRYNFNYWDKPGATQKGFNKLAGNMNRSQVDSTMLAVFSQSAGAFFSTIEIEDTLDPELCDKGDQAGMGKITAWMLDVGSVHDQSCLIGVYTKRNEKVPDSPLVDAFWIHKYPVGYPLARVVGVESGIDTDDGWADYAEDNPPVKEVLEEYTVIPGELPFFACDVTGNSGIAPLFHAVGIEPREIVFTGKDKWGWYQRYQTYVQQRWFKRCKDRDENTVRGCNFHYQAIKLVVKKRKSGVGSTSYKQIHHENEDDLDDTQDTIAPLIALVCPDDGPSLSYDIISNNGESIKEELEEDRKKAEKERKRVENYEKGDERLKDQYIPKFMQGSGMSAWLDNQERYT